LDVLKLVLSSQYKGKKLHKAKAYKANLLKKTFITLVCLLAEGVYFYVKKSVQQLW
jgi:hypothetical protein